MAITLATPGITGPSAKTGISRNPINASAQSQPYDRDIIEFLEVGRIRRVETKAFKLA
jgi:hypothetical protein